MSLDLVIFTGILILTAVITALPLFFEIIKKEDLGMNKKNYKKRGKPKISVKNSYWQRIKLFNSRITIAGKCFLVCAISLIGLSIWGKIRDDREKANATKEYTSELKNLQYQIDSSRHDPSERVSEGFSLVALLQIEDVLDKKRKYIFDCGASTILNRVSLYLDFDNNLVFTIIDNSGVPYSVRAVPDFVSFKRNTPYVLHCSVGYSNDFSFIRIFLDDRLVAHQPFNNRISAEKLNCNMPKIGCDIEGNFCGKFYLSSIVTYKRVFNRKEIVDMVNKMVMP